MSAATPKGGPPETVPPAAEPASRAEYEFADDDKDSFRALAASVSFVGVCAVLLGALGVLFVAGAVYGGFVAVGAALALVAALLLLSGWWMVSAGRSLSALVRTRGRDVQDLMEAVTQFRRLFGLACVVVVVVALGAVAAAGGLVVWCTSGADNSGRCSALFG